MKKITKSIFIFGLIFIIAIVFVSDFSYAEYPEKTITVIVPWDVGGVTDTTARALCSVTGRYLPVPFAIINRPGGASTIGQAEIVKAKPDGYTIGINTWGALVISPHIRKLPYTLEDTIIVLQIAAEDSIIAAHPERPYNNMRELIDYAKAHPKKINAGIHAPTTTGHFAFLELQLDHKVEFKIVPMGGGGPMKTALLGGHIDVAPLSVSEAMPYITTKKLKALGVTGSKGVEEFPDIITCEKQGFPVEAPIIVLLLVPRGVSEDKIKKLHDTFKKGLEDPTFLKMAQALNLQVAYLDGQAAHAKLKKFSEHYSKLIKTFDLEEKK